MACNFTVSAYFILLMYLTRLMAYLGKSKGWLMLIFPPKLQTLTFSNKLKFDLESIELASTDYGHLLHERPAAVLHPTTVQDIVGLITFAFNSTVPFKVAARGCGHSVHGQSMARKGVVVDMASLRRSRSGVSVSHSDSLGFYADVGGEQLWIDVLTEALNMGLAPVSWTDYLYLSVGGTLSNAGISGQSFLHGPQISNVHEMDVVTGKGDLVTCSPHKHAELFYAVLGGLGQFGIITRARVRLQKSSERVKWVRLLYTDFSAFTEDQERLISPNATKNGIDYLEGSILIHKGPLNNWRSSFYSATDVPKITNLLRHHGFVYCLEVAMNYGHGAQQSLEKGIKHLTEGLRFLEGFMFQKDVSYVDFLNRVRSGELALQSQGLWDVPHPWLNLFVPKSSISDFHDNVFKDVILRRNITTGVVLCYPMNRDRWDNRTSAVIPDEETFYCVGFLHSATPDNWQAYDEQNKEILSICDRACLGVKQYMAEHKTEQQWKAHFGKKWKTFRARKSHFDPKMILSPGHRIFDAPPTDLAL